MTTPESPITKIVAGTKEFLRSHYMAVGGTVLVWTVLGGVFTASDMGRNFEFQVARRAEFVTRDKLGLSPELDSHIKIFGYDDKAIAAFKNPDIPLGDWSLVIRAIEARKPRVILIDKIFGFIPQGEQTGLDGFLAALKAGGKNIALGSFLHSNVIPLREPLDIEREEFMLDNFVGGATDALTWLPIRNMQVYGPQKEISTTVGRIGQILNPGFGSIEPWVRVNGNRAVPHLSLLAAKELKVTTEGTFADGHFMPLDRHGLVNINFTSPAVYYKRALSMRGMINKARAGEPLTDISESDIVVLLPLMYTGNFDMMESPLGRIPSGFVHASLASSIVTGQWLKPTLSPWFLLFALIMTGALIGGMSGAVIFWPIFLSGIVAILTTTLGAFSFYGVVFPWLYPFVGFMGAALTMYAISVFELQERSRRLNDALNGLMPRHKLKELIAGKSQLTRDPCERVVTVMFLDIANFSAAAQERTPKEVFFHLKSIMNKVTQTVHGLGGTVDRTLGDGVLCFFGYSYDGASNANHADAAIACAREIQRYNVLKCIEDGKGSQPILPFRIGINTASAFIGDLGNPDRIDFTLIGNGVNLAQRLESACDHHSIMVSLTSFDLAGNYTDKSPGVSKRKIKIKHHEDLVDCVEIDPLTDMAEARSEATKTLRQRMGINRREQRWPVSSVNVPITLQTKFGPAKIVDFSKSGLCLGLTSYLAKGVQFGVEIETADKVMAEELRRVGVLKFRCEVRWGRPHEGQYIHGAQFSDLNESQALAFFEFLRTHLATDKSNVSELRRAAS